MTFALSGIAIAANCLQVIARAFDMHRKSGC